MIDIQEITSEGAFLALREEWNALLGRGDSACPYLRHEYLSAWWRGFGAGGRLHVIVARDGERLVGALPLMVSRRTIAGLPVTALHFLGINVGFLDYVIEGGRGDVFGPLFRRAFDAGRHHVLILRGIPAGGGHEQAVRAFLEAERAAHEVHEVREIALTVRGGWDGFRKERGTKIWSNVRNRTKKLEALGPVVLERHKGDAGSAEALEEAFALSLRSWKGEAGSAVGLQDPFRQFLRSLMEHGAGDLWVLRSNGRAIAYRLGFTRGKTWTELDIAYDREFAHLSPGTLLSARSNEALVQEGVAEINLGLDFPWKQEWSPEGRLLLEFLSYRRSGLWPRLVRGAQSLRRRYKAWRSPVRTPGGSGGDLREPPPQSGS